MKTEKLEFTTLDEFKQDLLNQDPTFADRLAVHKLQQAMIKQLKQDRLAQNLSQRDIAERTGIKVQNISRLERGLVAPKADTLLRYAQALGGHFQYMPSNA